MCHFDLDFVRTFFAVHPCCLNAFEVMSIFNSRYLCNARNNIIQCPHIHPIECTAILNKNENRIIIYPFLLPLWKFIDQLLQFIYSKMVNRVQKAQMIQIDGCPCSLLSPIENYGMILRPSIIISTLEKMEMEGGFDFAHL